MLSSRIIECPAPTGRCRTVSIRPPVGLGSGCVRRLSPCGPFVSGPAPGGGMHALAGGGGPEDSPGIRDSGRGRMEEGGWKRLATAAAVTTVVCHMIALAAPKAAHASTSGANPWDPREDQMGQRGRGDRNMNPDHGVWAEHIAAQAAKRNRDVGRKKVQDNRERRQQAQMVDHYSFNVLGYRIDPTFLWIGLIGGWFWCTQTFSGKQFVQNVVAKGKAMKGGNWVNDRSLGGKKVRGSFQESLERSKVTLKESDFAALSSFAAAANSKVDLAPAHYTRPPWWEAPPANLNASRSAQASGQQKANQILRRIEEGVVNGRDYRLVDVVRLREACQEGGVTVVPKTVGGRDGVFKAGVEGAVAAAMEATEDTDIGDNTPLRFVGALAADVGMPEERAVGLVSTAVMSKCRLRLVDALTSIKADDETSAMMAVIRLASLLENMRGVVSAGSKEVELLSSSLKATSTMEERKQIFYMFGQLYEDEILIVAELLGFDPAMAVDSFKAEMDKKRGRQ